ncbi:lipase family protein [Kocuria palustris]|uniref:lipase family protein n=1 Tax=Kocuria palustris TaxID=71999 RepID=UPI0009EF2A79|nr:lipase family protein [Kocuria palustris]
MPRTGWPAPAHPGRSRRRGKGNGAAAPSAPALIVHSVSDDVIPCRTGRALAGRWCAQGAGHVCGYVTSQPHILSFLQARFYGRAPVSTCARL